MICGKCSQENLLEVVTTEGLIRNVFSPCLGRKNLIWGAVKSPTYRNEESLGLHCVTLAMTG